MSGITEQFEQESAVFSASGRNQNVAGIGFLNAWGPTVPADDETGYGKGCHFKHTDGVSVTDLLYVNIGDKDACNFNPVAVTAD